MSRCMFKTTVPPSVYRTTICTTLSYPCMHRRLRYYNVCIQGCLVGYGTAWVHTCVCPHMCLQVRALCVHLATTGVVTLVVPSPPSILARTARTQPRARRGGDGGGGAGAWGAVPRGRAVGVEGTGVRVRHDPCVAVVHLMVSRHSGWPPRWRRGRRVGWWREGFTEWSLDRSVIRVLKLLLGWRLRGGLVVGVSWL